MISSKITFLTVVAACYIATCSAQIAVLTPCQNVTLEQNFYLSSYAGKWYEYQRYFTFFQFGGKCVTAYYTPNGTDTITVRNYLVKENTGEVNIILGSATLVSEVGEGELSLDFPSVGQVDQDYWVLGTDYNSFSVVWSCSNSGSNQSLQLAWLLTRDRVPSSETLALAQEVIDRNGLVDSFLITNHDSCPEDPYP
ncbi:lazarillo protein-like [Cloeon dipterum]|uniref:lazarillo protein-like n=1 Tax=Cloeon dipterum TaxID=197152 RepID=UPI0032206B3E